MSIIIELINKLSQSLMSKSKFFLENKNIKTKHPANFCTFFFFQSYLEYKNVWTKTTGKFFNHYSWGGWIFSWSWKYFINVIATFFNFLYDKCWQSLNFNNKWLCSFVQKTSYGAATIKKKQKCINSPWKKETIFILNIEVKDIFCLQNEKK